MYFIIIIILYIISQVGKKGYYDADSNQMTKLQEILAQNLREKRRDCGFSQEKLAEMVNVSTHHIATIETARNYPTLALIERMAKALNIEIYELFIDPLSTPEEMEQLYQTVAKNIEKLVSESMEQQYQTTAKNIEQLVGESMERLCQTTVKNIEQVIGEAIEKTLSAKVIKKG
ncbi:MAG: helix-turn-helix domain-containing protein [Treponema sp.]|jgi:transcriptional regulator with XRE-family HTH domain|nr:helix-turn-helix domain-containing protein [Treponema sp.]